jgi:hypothetical protein
LLPHVARETWLDDLRYVHAAQFLTRVSAQSFSGIINKSKISNGVEGKNDLMVGDSFTVELRT